MLPENGLHIVFVVLAGVDVDGVFRFFERIACTLAIRVVPCLQVKQDVGQGSAGILFPPPCGTDGDFGIKEEFERGSWKYPGTLIPAFRHRGLQIGNTTLFALEFLAHFAHFGKQAARRGCRWADQPRGVIHAV